MQGEVRKRNSQVFLSKSFACLIKPIKHLISGIHSNTCFCSRLYGSKSHDFLQAVSALAHSKKYQIG